ncbi:MAG: hypothetical protein V1706_03060 [Pseudomonadota bacterium]
MKYRNHVKRDALLAALALMLLMLVTPAASSAFEISIDVAPYVLNIHSDEEEVTVHTSLPYEDVEAHTVYLNGVQISSWKADNRGNFVAKFIMEDIMTLPLYYNDYNSLTLDGITVDDEPFFGQADIMVINVIPTVDQE